MMECPSAAVQDSYGELKDSNCTMIMIWDSKPKSAQKAKGTKNTHKSTGPRSFAFVNITRPKEGDEQVRKLIRTHVMQDLRRRERIKANDSKVLCRESITAQHYSLHSIPQSENPSAYPPGQVANDHTFIIFPVKMEPYMHRLIHHCGSLCHSLTFTGAKIAIPLDVSSIMHIMDPKQPANPAENVWFPMVMVDPALFHIILCISATYIDFVRGSKDSFPAQKHMLEAVSLINARFQRPDAAACISNATIAAITFMAKADVRVFVYE